MSSSHEDKCPKIKIAIVTSHPVHYFQTMYRTLNQHPALDITALFLSDFGVNNQFDPEFNSEIKWEGSFYEGYKWRFVGTKRTTLNLDSFYSIVCPQIWSEIRHSDFDVVWIHGYNYFGLILAFIAAKISKKRVFFRSETHLLLERSKFRQNIRDTILRLAFKAVDGFLAIGSLNAQYYEQLQVSSHKISLVPYTVDNERFEKNVLNSDAEKKSFLLSLNLNPSLPTIVFCSKFSARKNPDVVIKAFSEINVQSTIANLLMVGSGPLFEQHKELAASLNCQNLHFAGFVAQNDLPKYLSCGDLFIQPSENEPWGLVINEAMACGLPILAGKTIGSAIDLVEDGVNGYILPDLEQKTISTFFKVTIADSSKLKEMGQNSRERIRDWSYENCKKGVAEILRHNGYSI